MPEQVLGVKPFTHPSVRIEIDDQKVDAYTSHDTEEIVDCVSSWRYWAEREGLEFEVHWPEWKQKRDGGRTR